jgi:hypothetical protein
MTAGLRQTHADMQMWAQTSVLRWQHPIFRKHGAPQAPSLTAHSRVRMEAGRIGGGCKPSEEHVS